MIDPSPLLAASLLCAGVWLRAAAVLDDARRLKLVTDPTRDEGLCGSYVAARLGALVTAVALVWMARSLVGGPAAFLAMVAAVPLLALVDLVPRALARVDAGRPTGAAWTANLGRTARKLERAWTLADGSHAWTHEGLTALVRIEAPNEDAAERNMARRVYDFGDLAVADVMVPLVDVIAVRDDSPVEEVVRIATQEGFSRLPVFHERLPNVTGLLHVFDLLVPGSARTAAELMHPPTFVPEMTPASEVLRRLQVVGANLAVVVDEYGGAVGIVAVEDILEEVVGEIEDEYDEEEDPVRETGSNAWIVDGRAEIERLNERFRWQLPEGNYETLGGLMLARFARIPGEGEAIDLDRVVLRVTRASPRSVDEIAVEARSALEETP